VMMFLYELNRIRDTMADVSEVDGILKYLNGTFAIGLQNPQTIANFAIEIERYNLPKDYYRNYLKNLAAITPADVQKTAQKYVLPAQAYIICVGNKAAIAEGLGKYAASGKVEFFDMFGNEVKEAPMPLPAGLTAEKVIENYITAIGGRKAWSKVKSLDMTMGATVQNMSLDMQVKKMQPNLMLTQITLNGAMTMQKIVFDGQKGKASGMQGSENLEGEKLEEIKESAAMLPEANYLDGKTKLSLMGIEKLNATPAYVVAVEMPSGKKITEYYEVATGLKIREVSTVDGPQGESAQITDLSDYRTVKPGVMIPHTTTLDMGAQLIKLEMKSITLNGKMNNADFEVK
jgi:zinc protease